MLQLPTDQHLPVINNIIFEIQILIDFVIWILTLSQFCIASFEKFTLEKYLLNNNLKVNGMTSENWVVLNDD